MGYNTQLDTEIITDFELWDNLMVLSQLSTEVNVLIWQISKILVGKQF